MNLIHATLGLIFLSCVWAQRQPGPGYQELSSCPEQYGLQTYPHPAYCDQFYLCANGTLSLETCGHGLLFDGKGNVHNHCNYHWGVNCGDRVAEVIPNEANAPCIFDYGIFPTGPQCDTNFIKCEAGYPITEPCETGLGYDESIHGCNWPDLVPGCDAEQIVGFKCPTSLPSNSPSLKFWPFPRFTVQGDCSVLVTCVNNLPRLIKCGGDQLVNPYSLTCDDPRNVQC